MLLDNQALFSDQQAITSTAASDNFINLGAPGTPPHAPASVNQDIGGGNSIPLLVQVTEDFVGGASVRVDVQIADNDAFSDAEIVMRSPTLYTDVLVAGYVVPLTVIPQGTDMQYIRINFTVSGTYTAGKITAGISAGNQTNG